MASSKGQRKDGKTGLAGLGQAAKVIERMVNQNTYDDIAQGKVAVRPRSVRACLRVCSGGKVELGA